MENVSQYVDSSKLPSDADLLELLFLVERRQVPPESTRVGDIYAEEMGGWLTVYLTPDSKHYVAVINN